MKVHELIRFRFIFASLLILTIQSAPTSIRAQSSWQATVGAQSRDKGRQGMAFLPNEIWVHRDDTINWKFDADAVHTVTFLAVGQTRLQNLLGCGTPATTPDGAPFDGSTCVNGGRMTNGDSYSVTFPKVGDFKLVCLVHPNMTGTIHVLEPLLPLPHTQDFYDDEAIAQRKALLFDRDGDEDHDRDDFRSHPFHHHRNQVAAGIGEIVANAGGFQNLSVMRFFEHTQVIHVGETVEWNNDDPVEPHTITFGDEPQNLMPPSANVTLGLDGARYAVIASTSDSVHSGFIVAPPQERIGLVQVPLPPLPGSTVTRFRVKFTSPGTFPYICALHDEMGMKGKVIVLP